MAWYRSGTVTAAAGQNVITGTGTQWANNVMGVAPGQALVVQRSDGNTLIYEILAVDSNTKIRINGNVVDALVASNYGIQTSVSNSYSALARETSAQLALYQQLLEDWQLITTGAGNVTIIAPDGIEVTIPSMTQMATDISNKASQQQLNSGLATKMPLGGGVFSGPVTLQSNGISPLSAATAGQLTGIVGSATSLTTVQVAAEVSMIFNGNGLIVQSSNGVQYLTGSFNAGFNCTTTGIGGMATTLVADGFVGIYAIYNPTSGDVKTIAIDATSSASPIVFSGTYPAGYTASALISVWRVASSSLVIGIQKGREIVTERNVAASGSGVVTLAGMPVFSFAPRNSVQVLVEGAAVYAGSTNTLVAMSSTGQIGATRRFQNGSGISIGSAWIPLTSTAGNITLSTYASVTSGSYSLSVLGYTL